MLQVSYKFSFHIVAYKCKYIFMCYYLVDYWFFNGIFSQCKIPVLIHLIKSPSNKYPVKYLLLELFLFSKLCQLLEPS